MTEQYSNTGDESLKVIDKATRFTEWMYAQIKPYLSGTILEVGSGIGTYSKKIIRDFGTNHIILSELDPDYVKELQVKFTTPSTTILPLDLTNFAAVQALPPLNAAFALNVLEHIEHDTVALQNVYNQLTSGGYFIVLVPAHPALYNRIDRAIGHFRRYTKKEVRAKAENAGFIVENLYFFNCFSIPGWYINGNILRKEVIDDKLITIFDRFVPLFRFIEEKLFRRSIGISIIAILKKP